MNLHLGNVSLRDYNKFLSFKMHCGQHVEFALLQMNEERNYHEWRRSGRGGSRLDVFDSGTRRLDSTSLAPSRENRCLSARQFGIS